MQRGMFERFTPNARTAVVLAQDIARIRGQAAIDTGHLLGGLVHGRPNSAAALITRLGVDAADLRRRADEGLARGAGAPGGSVPFAESAKQVLLLSLREALRLQHDHIGTEHLLVGLIREHGAAAEILSRAGVRLGAVRAQLERMPARQVEAPPAAGTAVADDDRHPGLGRVFMLYHGDDLAPGVPDDLESAFCAKGLVLYSSSTDLDPVRPSGALAATMSTCDVVLALIGPHWLQAVVGPAADPVRTALEAARSLRKPTVPALLGNVAMPRAGELPADLGTLLHGDPIRIVPGTLPEHIAGLMRLYLPLS